MQECEAALELISAHLDGELTPEETARLEAHLAQCPQCRALLADLTALHEAMPRQEVPPPAGLKDGVMARIAAEAPLPFTPPARKKIRWKAWASLAAVVAIVLVGSGPLREWNAAGSPASDRSRTLSQDVAAGSGAGNDSAQATAGTSALPEAVPGAPENTANAQAEPEAAAQPQEASAPEGGEVAVPEDAGGAAQPDSQTDFTSQSEQQTSGATGGAQAPAAPSAPAQSTAPAAESAPTPQPSPTGDSNGLRATAPSTLTIAPASEPAPTATPAALSEEEARQALVAWLTAKDAGETDQASPQPASIEVTGLGLSSDGKSYRFQCIHGSNGEQATIYLVSLDGQEIRAETP